MAIIIIHNIHNFNGQCLHDMPMICTQTYHMNKLFSEIESPLI